MQVGGYVGVGCAVQAPENYDLAVRRRERGHRTEDEPASVAVILFENKAVVGGGASLHFEEERSILQVLEASMLPLDVSGDDKQPRIQGGFRRGAVRDSALFLQNTENDILTDLLDAIFLASKIAGYLVG
jgi:hypothetical protein